MDIYFKEYPLLLNLSHRILLYHFKNEKKENLFNHLII